MRAAWHPFQGLVSHRGQCTMAVGQDNIIPPHSRNEQKFYRGTGLGCPSLCGKDKWFRSGKGCRDFPRRRRHQARRRPPTHPAPSPGRGVPRRLVRADGFGLPVSETALDDALACAASPAWEFTNRWTRRQASFRAPRRHGSPPLTPAAAAPSRPHPPLSAPTHRARAIPPPRSTDPPPPAARWRRQGEPRDGILVAAVNMRRHRVFSDDHKD